MQSSCYFQFKMDVNLIDIDSKHPLGSFVAVTLAYNYAAVS